MNKRTCIVLLVGVNLFLLAALVFSVFPGPAAYAQRVGISGNFMMVTAEIQDGYDALYLFDVADRKMYAFSIEKGGAGRLEVRDFRDLKADFRE
jgi:hypothetical protein